MANDERKKSQKSFLTYQQRFQLGKIIEAHGSVQDGYFKYDQDWDDARVAKEAGMSETNVVNARSALFGPLKRAPGSGKSPLAQLFNRVAILEERVATLEAGKLRTEAPRPVEARPTNQSTETRHFEQKSALSGLRS